MDDQMHPGGSESLELALEGILEITNVTPQFGNILGVTLKVEKMTLTDNQGKLSGSSRGDTFCPHQMPSHTMSPSPSSARRLSQPVLPLAACLLVLLAPLSPGQLPALTIERGGGGAVVLSWPASATGFVLQSTDDPAIPESWQTVPGNYTTREVQLLWTNTLPGPLRFFRLARFGSAPLPTPANALLGSIASMGTPWSVMTDTNSPGSPAIPGLATGSVPRIVGFPNDDGSIDVAWIGTQSPPAIVITHVVPEGAGFRAAWHLKPHTLGYLGGFARDEDGNMFYLTTIAEDITTLPQPSHTHRPGIAQLVKLAPLGHELFRTDLRTDMNWPGATPLYSPMSWGTSRIAVGNGRIMMTFAANTEFDPPVNSRHQWHVYLGVNASTGATDFYADAFGHCWDQRLIFHDGKFIGTSLGDAGLRGIGVANAESPHHRAAFAIKGGDVPTVPFYQNVFTRLGDLAPGDAGYGLLFATERTATYTGGTSPVVASRNIAFVHIRSDFEEVPGDFENPYDVAIVDTNTGNPGAQTFDVPIRDYWGTPYDGKNKGLVWLTNYSNRDTENAERPHLVSIGEDRFIALWEKWTLSAYSDTFAALLDEYGNVLKAPKSLGSGYRLHRQDSPFRFGDKAAWITGETSVTKLVLCTLDADLNPARHEVP